MPFLCEIGVLLAKQYVIGKNKFFREKLEFIQQIIQKREK
ncbi:hypothetical protein BN193_09520 [Lactococcus raffinolactis 4877]|nr:hypothetical protein BN193_09520 [Lactococcus raffinolactis 4877]